MILLVWQNLPCLTKPTRSFTVHNGNVMKGLIMFGNPEDWVWSKTILPNQLSPCVSLERTFTRWYHVILVLVASEVTGWNLLVGLRVPFKEPWKAGSAIQRAESEPQWTEVGRVEWRGRANSPPRINATWLASLMNFALQTCLQRHRHRNTHADIKLIV